MKIVELGRNTLRLKNDGDLELFFLGVGSAFTKKQNQTNLVIIKGDNHLLVDCGTKCNKALYSAGLSVTDIDNYFITHSHADHIGGLEEVALMNRYVKKRKPNIVISKEYQDILWNESLRGGCAHNEEDAGDILQFEDFWNVIRPVQIKNSERMLSEANIGNMNIKIFRTTHIPDSSVDWKGSFWSTGILIDDKILFTSDTKYDPELLEWLEMKFDLEIIFHDSQFYIGGVHASIDELKQLRPEIKKKMMLVHYGDNWEEYEKKMRDYGFKCFGRQFVYYNFGK